MRRGREAVKPRQDDEEERGAGQAPAADGRGPGRGPRWPRRDGGERRSALLEGDAAQRRRAHEQGLLQDQHEGGRHDVAAIAAGRIEQRLVQHLDRRAFRQRRAIEAAVGPGVARQQVGGDRAARLEDALERPVVEQEIDGIDIGRQRAPGGPPEHRARFRPECRRCRTPRAAPAPPALRRACSGAPRPASPRAAFRAWMSRPAELGGIVVDDGDGYGADELSEIGLRIEHAIDDAAPARSGRRRRGRAARGDIRRQRRRRCRPRAPAPSCIASGAGAGLRAIDAQPQAARGRSRPAPAPPRISERLERMRRAARRAPPGRTGSGCTSAAAATTPQTGRSRPSPARESRRRRSRRPASR